MSVYTSVDPNVILCYIPFTGSPKGFLEAFATATGKNMEKVEVGNFTTLSRFKAWVDTSERRKSFWYSAYKIGFVRNPADWLLDRWRWQRASSVESFVEFLERLCTHVAQGQEEDQVSYLVNRKGNRLLTDYAGRDEDEDCGRFDMSVIFKKLGLEIPNPKITPWDPPDQPVECEKEMVRRICARDLEYFNYKV